MTHNDSCLSAIRALALAVRDGNVTCPYNGDIHIDGAPANDFQLLTLSVMYQWGWIAWTFAAAPPQLETVAVLTELGEHHLASHIGLDLSDPAQWQAFMRRAYAVTPADLESGGTK